VLQTDRGGTPGHREAQRDLDGASSARAAHGLRGAAAARASVAETNSQFKYS
jgi:hypothetical protein